MPDASVFSLEMKDISKSFPGVKALNKVDLAVRKGEVHALMGENGAGKSTLMKILAGIYTPDSGELIVNGTKVEFNNPRDALKKGISMIHQELSFIPGMTVSQNVFLGREPSYKGFGVVNRGKTRQMTRDLFKRVGIDINPDAEAASLSVAELQMVEIAKAISYNSDIIVMDEPTSAITEREVEKLFAIIKMLTNEGKAIIYISHKMKEIFEIADTITVLRDGTYIGTHPAKELTNKKLIQLMVGRELSGIYEKQSQNIGSALLEVRDLQRKGVFDNINFTLHRGEILGIAGLVGAGRTEIVESIFGHHPHDGGEIRINDIQVRIRKPKDAIRHGIALVTEDRKLLGLNLKGTVGENITLASLKNYTILNQVIKRKKERTTAANQIKALNVKTSSQDKSVNFLSGGNQQKVVLGKWLLTNPDILILDEPTRGIDIGAKFEVYDIISDIARQGKAIILISSEMPELIGMSDRILAIHQGTITGEFARDEFNQEHILHCCTGHSKGEFTA